jgi:hypothetical protein
MEDRRVTEYELHLLSIFKGGGCALSVAPLFCLGDVQTIWARLKICLVESVGRVAEVAGGS